MKTPVLIDFWAEWCNPCKMLSPVLEKLEKEYKGSFILAKVDTDSNQNLAAMFKISSIPDVKLISGGKIVDQFVGALPEKEIRKFLDKHIKQDASNNPLLELAIKKPMEALKQIKNAKEPVDKKDELLWTAFVSHIINKGKFDEVKEILAEVDDDTAFRNQKTILIDFFEKYKKSGLEDLSTLYSKSSDKKISILDKYLKLIEDAKYADRAKIKNDLLACFYVLSPEDEDVSIYRRKLSSLLF
jgi:putative thioredoxin